MSKEREDIRQGWYYVKVPEGAPEAKLIHREDGVALSRRRHGASGRVRVTDHTSSGLHPATMMRVVAMLDAGDDAVSVVLDDAEGGATLKDDGILRLNGPAIAEAASPHHLDPIEPSLLAVARRQHTPPEQVFPPASKVLCFESLLIAVSHSIRIGF